MNQDARDTVIAATKAGKPVCRICVRTIEGPNWRKICFRVECQKLNRRETAKRYQAKCKASEREYHPAVKPKTRMRACLGCDRIFETEL